MSPVLGIDLGTTNSVVAVMEGGIPTVIANREGRRTTPSVVHYPGGDEEIVVGDLARRMLAAEPDRTVRSIKRFMGKRFSECDSELESIGYRVEADPYDNVNIAIGEARLTPEAISAQVLAHMRDVAEEYIGESINQAVVTVPAYFNDTQRQATMHAGELAGLDVLRVVNEPTAACLAFGFDKTQEQKVAVFDFGGGTFDISLLELDEGVFEVKSTCGDMLLGGDNLDTAVANFIRDEIQMASGYDVSSDPKGWQRVMESAEKIKCELSSLETTTISLPFIGMADNQPVHFEREIDRMRFEEIIAEELARLEPPCQQALSDAGWDPSEINTLLMVGGSTRIPVVQKIAKEVFKTQPQFDLNPDEAVAQGAAILSGVLTGALAEVLLLDVTPLSLGLASQGDIFNVLIPRNSSIPTEASKGFTTTRDFQKSVKVNVLQGERKVASNNRKLATFRLEDVTPAPKGVPHIDVNFRIDVNGILEVRATDISTGAQHEVRIDSFMASKEESERMMKAAQEAMAEDHAHVQTSALRLRAAKLQEAVRSLMDEVPDMHEDDRREMTESMVRMDVAFHIGDGDMLDEARDRLIELAEKQGDLWLGVKVRYDLDQSRMG